MKRLKVEPDSLESEDKNPEQIAIERDLRESLEKAINNILNSRYRGIIRMRFGLGDYREHSLREIGEKLSRSPERIRQLEAKILVKLYRAKEVRKIAELMGYGSQ